MVDSGNQGLAGATAGWSASTPGQARRYDLDDFEQFPEDGLRREIIDGELFVTAAPYLRHQAVSRNLELLLVLWARERRCGQVFDAPVDVQLGNHDIVEPDLVYVSNARRSLLTPRRIVGAPDLVVEILSPSTERNDRERKLSAYDRFGVVEYWIVDPDAGTIIVHARDAADRLVAGPTFTGSDVLVSALLPGFAAPLVEVFAED